MDEKPLHDVIATQGIIAVLLGIIVCILQLLAPQYCSELLETWARIAAESPSVVELWLRLSETVQAWFA